MTRCGVGFLLVMSSVLLGCGDSGRACVDCGTIVIAATGEPSHLLPPLVFETVARDISDQVYERLAYLAPRASPIDAKSFRPGLAERWERVDSLTWRFHLRPGARWQDGRPVTADDVAFSFDAFSDSTLDAGARGYLAGKVWATVEDSATVRIGFADRSPEQLYDATYHVRILPRHVWDSIPRDRWAADTNLAHLVGSGPYRIQSWERGRFLILVVDSARAGAGDPPAVSRAIWRFAPDPDATLNLLLSHEADLMETVGAPDRVGRVSRDTSFKLVTYPAAVYGFLAFRVADAAGRPHPVLGKREVRHALAQAVDRPTLARALFGEGTKAPPGPMSQLLWIWDDETRVVQFNSARAREVVAAIKRRHRLPAIDILVPSTSSSRRQLAVAVQEAWRKAGVNATVTAVEFPVFQERLATGRFDSYIGAYLDEPSPRGLADQWTRAGWGATNYGHYANAAFDSLLGAASREEHVANARRLWREALDTLNADVPAIFLYSLANVAAVERRLEGVEIDPYSWASGLSTWNLDQDRVLARDSTR
ncbi:MAG TPA: peptide ABC transporter substrate-binding protein [Gemmatimonadales bacterium]|nr:peptide ABC transporter substrate-binding protein [Gemmatimonadales bacterium]